MHWLFPHDKYPVFLAPMEDVTDIGFRLLCREMGADMVYSEFVSSDALVRNVNRSLEKLEVSPDERPVAIQIYGRFPEAMRDAAQRVVEEVLQNIPLMLEITRAVVDAVPDTPVTVKTRLGWDEGHRIITDLAEELQDCGIRALTIHGRTRAQMYTGEADWTLIGAVKQNPRMHIPIIGNGDITSPERARECFERYGVDAVMVGRATFGRPWIFKEIKDYLRDGHYTPLTADEQMDILKRQIAKSVERLDEYRGILHVRRHLAATPLFKGIPNFREMRIRMLRAERVDELCAILEEVRPLVRQKQTETDSITSL